MVGRRTLTPLIKVRILVPQPNKIKDLKRHKFLNGTRLQFLPLLGAVVGKFPPTIDVNRRQGKIRYECAISPAFCRRVIRKQTETLAGCLPILSALPYDNDTTRL